MVTLASAAVFPTVPSNCVAPEVLIVSARGVATVSEFTVLPAPTKRIAPPARSTSTASAVSTTGPLYVCPPAVWTVGLPPPLMSMTAAVTFSDPARISGTAKLIVPNEVRISGPVVVTPVSSPIGSGGSRPGVAAERSARSEAEPSADTLAKVTPVGS